MCPVERERDPSGCRASGHSIAPGSFVFARCGGYKKAQDITRAGHRMVQSTLLLSFVLHHRRHRPYKRGRLSDGYITMKFNKIPFNYSRHNWPLCINQYSLWYFLIITEHLKIRIKTPTATGLVVIRIIHLWFRLLLGQSQRARTSWVHDIEECKRKGSHNLCCTCFCFDISRVLNHSRWYADKLVA